MDIGREVIHMQGFTSQMCALDNTPHSMRAHSLQVNKKVQMEYYNMYSNKTYKNRCTVKIA